MLYEMGHKNWYFFQTRVGNQLCYNVIRLPNTLINSRLRTLYTQLVIHRKLNPRNNIENLYNTRIVGMLSEFALIA